MIIAKAPLRVSFIGGGTDYKTFCEQRTGGVIGATIDKYVYVMLSDLPSFAEQKIRFTYRVTENAQSLDELQHPSAREILRYFGMNSQVNIATWADLPGGTGLGSSSAFAVALIAAISGYRKLQLNSSEIAEIAIKIERDVLKEPGGMQDQMHAAFGGFRMYTFDKQSNFGHPQYLDGDLLAQFSNFFSLVYVGSSRKNSDAAILTRQAATNTSVRYLNLLAEGVTQLHQNLLSQTSISEASSLVFESINRGWDSKKLLIGNHESPNVEGIINSAFTLGARAAKLCGAGGTGFVLIGHEPEIKSELQKEFGLAFTNFSFEENGAKIVLQDS